MYQDQCWVTFKLAGRNDLSKCHFSSDNSFALRYYYYSFFLFKIKIKNSSKNVGSFFFGSNKPPFLRRRYTDAHDLHERFVDCKSRLCDAVLILMEGVHGRLRVWDLPF